MEKGFSKLNKNSENNPKISNKDSENSPKASKSERLVLPAKGEYRDVYNSIARNQNTPLNTLTLLARNEDKDIRMAVAANPSTPPKALTLLAKDEDEGIRMAVNESEYSIKSTRLTCKR